MNWTAEESTQRQDVNFTEFSLSALQWHPHVPLHPCAHVTTRWQNAVGQ